MDPVIVRIRQELDSLADEKTRITSQRFFKEEISCYGIKTPVVTALAKKYWKEIKHWEKREIFALCEELYRSGKIEESFVVSTWAYALADRFDKKDLAIFQRWIDTYITNWASCDGFCNHAMGEFFERYPECMEELHTWARSENRWMRRAAAVCLIVPAKHGKFLPEAIGIAKLLLNDSDDMVQKGYGWLLKEASRKHTREVFDFVVQNRKVMPRTALRYAIELMPKDLKVEAMKKEG
ncbi:DNA alkylation repair protein [Methanoregula sp.]|uniref:DNA alkylation repair protein n=1 Tax=Methanoregula sp. TaxID=2052170 RepID=UPI002C128DE0|nr:DNA alkylation repair protein [Methanoregula sp.]HVP95710.1 DNA alkylation repair protein [Methanoregula sp.]